MYTQHTYIYPLLYSRYTVAVTPYYCFSTANIWRSNDILSLFITFQYKWVSFSPLFWRVVSPRFSHPSQALNSPSGRNFPTGFLRFSQWLTCRVPCQVRSRGMWLYRTCTPKGDFLPSHVKTLSVIAWHSRTCVTIRSLPKHTIFPVERGPNYHSTWSPLRWRSNTMGAKARCWLRVWTEVMHPFIGCFHCTSVALSLLEKQLWMLCWNAYRSLPL